MATRYPKRKRPQGEDDRDRDHKQQKQFPKRPKPSRAPDQHRHPYAKSGFRRREGSARPEEEAEISINALKSRIRDLTRLLAHADNDPKNRMPQGIRIERERELESCKHELEEKQTAQREANFRKVIIGKYHMVRFFERQKATRTLKRLHKQLASLENEEEKADKLRSIHNAEVDFNYAIYYPLLKPYVSLFPKGGGRTVPGVDAEQFADGPKGDMDMWKRVERAMEEQSLEALRESREGVVIPGAPDASQGKKAKNEPNDGNNKKQPYNTGDVAATEVKDEEDEDGGEGFFI